MLISLILFVVAASGGGWLLAQSRAATYDRAVRADENALLGLELDIRHSVDTMDLALRAAVSGARLPGLQALPDAVRQAVLFDGAVGTQVFGGVYITDENGQIAYDSASKRPRDINVRDRDYFHAHQANPSLDLLLTGPTLSRLDGRWALFLSRRVSHPDGSFGGVAVGSIELDILQDMFDGLATDNGGVVALFTTDGRLLVRKPAGLVEIDRDISQGPVIRHLALASSGVFESRSASDQIDRILVYRRVGSYPLGIVIGTARDELYAGWATRASLVGGAVGCLMLLVAGLGRRLRRELRQRAAAERVARTYADEVRLLTDHASDLLLRLDWDGRCRFVSPACASIFGYPDHMLLMRNWLDLVHPDDRMLLAAALLDRSVSPPPRPPIVRVRHQNGTWRQVEAHSRALPGDNGVIVVVHDVTRRVELEAKLLQAHRMEALGQLTAGVAHDFNNILQAQLGSLELLLDTLTETSESWGLASQALELGERGARLTSQLRSFSRQQHLQPQAIPVAEFLAHLIETIGKAVGPGTRIVQWVEPGTPALYADHAHLESALLNLVLNARDAMTDGGTITIEGRLAPAQVSQPDHPAHGFVMLTVEDNGSGMDDATLERACEPFFTTKGVNGTGLGLSSVQGFIAQSGGEFCIRSALGQGSVVELSLPVAVERDMPPLRDEPQAGARGRLLFVDDAPDVLVTVGSFLRGAGFEVVPAWGAELALRTLREDGPFDCLITDFVMPDMNGIELITRARLICPDLPALVITAWMQELRLAEVGPLWILQKPFRRDTLVRELQRIIATRQPALVQSRIMEGI
jgi:PAS domain S-box-containing protein